MPRTLSSRVVLQIERRALCHAAGLDGAELRADKRGAIPIDLAPIVERLGLNRSNWVETVRGFGRRFIADFRGPLTCLFRTQLFRQTGQFFPVFLAFERPGLGGV